MHGYALKCYALLCFPLLCFDFEAGSSPSPGSARKCKKFTQFMQQFEPNRKFLEKITFSDPFLTPIANSSKKCPLRPPLWGGPRPGPKSEKLQLKNNRKLQGRFLKFRSRKSSGNRQFLYLFNQKARKNEGTHESGSRKIVVRRNPAR